jgi:hypothetical protein
VKIPKLNKWDCVRIVWSDPHAIPGEWQRVSAKDMSVDGCVTVGQVYKVHADRLTVLCTYDTILRNANGGITIPFVNIAELTVLARATEFD